MRHGWLSWLLVVVPLCVAAPAGAVSSAELYQNQVYGYGRFEARMRFAPGDGVISSFFLWKPGSEVAGTFWNELDFEKLGADCHLQTNALYGAPAEHSRNEVVAGDLCGQYHTYTFEWTPSSISWLVDGIELRREAGETASAFAQNASAGMQAHLNIWPGDATFGGNFDPAILPVRQYVSWVQYSSYADGAFVPVWREDFAGATLPSGWALGNWLSAKNLSTHAASNVNFIAELAVLSLTADEATGFNGTPPADDAASAEGAVAGDAGASSNTADATSAGAGMPPGAAAPSGSLRANKGGGCSYGQPMASRPANTVSVFALGLITLLAGRRRWANP